MRKNTGNVREKPDRRKKKGKVLLYNVKCDFFVTRYSILVIILTGGMRNTCHILTLSGVGGLQDNLEADLK